MNKKGGDFMCKNIEEMAIEARRSYQREWRRKNPDKVRENNRRYWERKAQKMFEQAKSEQEAR